MLKIKGVNFNLDTYSNIGTIDFITFLGFNPLPIKIISF